jgi:hypothetical protein
MNNATVSDTEVSFVASLDEASPRLKRCFDAMAQIRDYVAFYPERVDKID